MRLSIIFFFCLFLLLGCLNQVEEIHPQRIPMTESVYASVKVQSKDYYTIFANIPGLIESIAVAEGDEVRKGQFIAQINQQVSKIDAENAQLSLQEAKNDLSGKTAILKGIDHEIKAAQLKLTSDSLNFYRQKRLWQQGVGARVELDSRQLNYELALTNLQNLKEKLLRTKRELNNRVQQSENRLKTADTKLKDYRIVSQMEGIIYDLYKETGETISLQEPLAVVGSKADFVVEMLVDEVDIVALELGQKTLVTLDAYADQVFTGKITKIYPQKDERNQTFRVEAAFLDAPPKLYPGLSGEANIIVAEQTSALVIPVEYLLENNKVLTKNGEKEITTGLKNMRFVEVTSGIDTTVVLLNPFQ